MNNLNNHHEYCSNGQFDPEDIVISGISGRFPKCESVGELQDALFTGKKLLMLDDFYEKKNSGIPVCSVGAIPNPDKFDAECFGYSSEEANLIDTESRLSLEVTYEAISDAGYDPHSLSGANIGIYNASIYHDSKHIFLRSESVPPFGFVKAMKIRHLAQAFNFLGPSVTFDTGCSSSAVALWQAVNDIRAGRIDAAIVNGTQINLLPLLSEKYFLWGLSSKTGNSIPFDAVSDGLIRSESVTTVFLQKASNARRCYAKVLGAKFYNAGNYSEGLSVPSEIQQVNCIRDVLKECGLKPEDIDFIESHGTGTPIGDPIEINAIATAFDVDKRKKPFYVGAIKSDIGHTEAASGLCGLLKAIICCETGLIPPNPRFKTPHPACKPLVQGKMKIVTETIPSTSPYIVVNSFGLAGTIVNIVVQQNPKDQSKKEMKSDLPKFVLFSATTEKAVQFMFDYIKNNPDLSEEFFALLHKLSFCPPKFKSIRGYALFQDYNSPLINIRKTEDKKREVWFVYNGMGSQWRSMGLQLMKIEVFSKSMKKSAAITKRFGIDLFEILNPNSDILEQDGIASAVVVGIMCVEIALTDLLRYLDIQPDGIIGHSVGEIAAAYGDGCITAEQAVEIACVQGLISDRSESIKGALFATGLSWEEACKICPENVSPACHNSDDSVTISGPKKDVYPFAEKLKEQNIFCRLVPSNGIYVHNPLVGKIVPGIRSKLSEVLKQPRTRSEKWISTSFLKHEWDNPKCKVAGPDYFTNNLTAPVYFKEVTDYIPKSAIVIEIGPHGLLQAILKKNLDSTSTCLSLMKRNETNSLKYLFDSLGKLYTEGLEPKVERLYPPIKFPVSRNTQRISDLIKWNHDISYYLPTWSLRSSGHVKFFPGKEDSYLLDHFIAGRSLFPATGYLYIIWEFMAKTLEKDIRKFSVVIENFKIHRATVITSSGPVVFDINLLSESGCFEIINDYSVVATGKVCEWKKGIFASPKPVYECDSDSVIEGPDIYNELRMIGYEYGPQFQGLSEINADGTQGLVTWNDQWIPFLDSLLLFFGIITNSGQFQLPVGLQSIKIDPHLFYQHVKGIQGDKKSIPINYNPFSKMCYTFGIEITDLITNPAPRRYKEIHETLEEYKFIPYQCKYSLEENSEIQLYMIQCNKMLDILGDMLNVEVQNYKFHVEEANINATDCLKDLSEEHNLLKCLKELTENFKNSKGSNHCDVYLKNIGKDILNCVMTNEYILRIIIEIITENSFRKLNVVELYNDNFPVILPSVVEIVNKYTNLKCNTKVLLTSENSKIDSKGFCEHGIQVASKNILTDMSEEKDKDVAISSFMNGSLGELKNLIYTLSSVVKSTGFILLYCKEQILPIEKLLLDLSLQNFQTQTAHLIEKVFEENHLIVISKISDSFGGIVYLLRRSDTIKPHKIIKVINDNFSWVEQLKKEMTSNSPELLWLIADDTEINGVVGLVNCLKQEPKGDKIRCLFLTPEHKNSRPSFSFEHPFYQTILTKNLVMNVWKNGLWGSYRHVLLKNKKDLKIVEHSYASCHKLGDLSSFKWVESFVKYAKTSSTLVHIYYSALNFKDVMLATGKLSSALGVKNPDKADDSILGLEFSGRDQKGNRVAGIVTGCGIATSTLVDPMFLIDVPDNWSLEDAATVPIVYATCYYALIVRAQLQKGETILIHSGTGGIGIAAINIALSLQCEVFVTVGNEEKKKFLKKIFPEIKEGNIGCSRNTLFKKMIKENTKGNGVDVVLNSLADDKFQASIQCLARNGRFAEIGKYDLSLDRTIGLKLFLKNITFHGVSLDELFENTASSRREFCNVMQLVRDGIKCNVVKPLHRTLFQSNEVEEAFRYMTKGVHVGKVLLKIRDEEPSKQISPVILSKPAIPVTYFYSSKVYIIIGGLGGFGIEVAKWIISRGGRNIILTSRYGVRTPYHQFCIQRLQKRGINIKVMTLDASKINEAEQLLIEAMKIATIGGIFNSAVVLKDAFIDSQNSKKYEEVCGPKAAASKYLDVLTRKLCPSLDYFVCFSSISCGRGNAGQSNYGYANSVMERICEKRRESGLHGLAIQWGIIGEVGIVHRHMGDDAMIAGVSAQSVKSCLEALDLFCQSDCPVVSSYILAVANKTTTDQTDIVDKVSKIIGMSGSGSSSRTFGEMGLDSLMGVEVKQLLDNAFDISITISELLDMKMSDIITLSSKTVGNKRNDGDSKMSSLVSSTNIKLPPKLLHTDVLIPLNKETKLTPVFLVHIGDTDLSDFQLLSQNIHNPIYALLWTKSVPSGNLESVAAWYFELIQSKVHGPFHLIGYSLGGSLAFEIALLSENTTSHAKSITLLDGSSNLLNNLNKAQHTKHQDVSILCNFIEQFSSDPFPKLETELVNARNLDKRISKLIQFLSTSCSESINKSELSDVISEYIKKSKIIYSYLPSRKLMGDIILIENPVQVLANDISEIKSLFSHICSGNLEVHRSLPKHELSSNNVVQRLLTIFRQIF